MHEDETKILDSPDTPTVNDEIPSESVPPVQKDCRYKKSDNPKNCVVSFRCTAKQKERIEHVYNARLKKGISNNLGEMVFQMFEYCEENSWGDFYTGK